ncbi:MAG: 7TM-DISM domain-containing protein [Oligoflexus sp.]
MKHLLSFLICSIVITTQAIASQGFVEVDADLSELNLNHSLWFFEDQNHQFNENDLNNNQFQEKFSPSKKRTPNFGFSQSSWWARARLKNTNDQALTVFLSSGYPVVDQHFFS